MLLAAAENTILS